MERPKNTRDGLQTKGSEKSFGGKQPVRDLKFACSATSFFDLWAKKKQQIKHLDGLWNFKWKIYVGKVEQ